MNYGRFSISKIMIDDEPKMILKALKGIIIVKAEFNLVSNCVDYVGLSENFKIKNNPATEPPFYHILVTREKGKVKKLEWVPLW